MKKLFGTPFNMNSGCLGKITRLPISRWKRQNYILIANNECFSYGYSAIISDTSIVNHVKTSMVHNIVGLEQLKDGDVVFINPDGNINVLYEIGSNDNIIFATGLCNCSCIMCPQALVDKEQDKTPFNIKLISLIDKNTDFLAITGGEPTLLGDKLIALIKYCKRHLPKTALNLLTNGILFKDYEYVKRLSGINHPNLIFEIPLYADTDNEHNRIIRAKGFYDTIKGLYNLALFMQKVSIRIVINKMTFQRLPQFAEFIYRNFPFVIHIAFMQMEPIGIARENIEKLWIDPFDYNDQLEKSIIYLFYRGMNVSIYNSQLCLLPKTLRRFACKSISSWKNIYIAECNDCYYRDNCGGFFASSSDKHSSHIKPFKKDDVL